MPQSGDVIETSLCAEYFGQQACNVFYWVVAAWTGNMTLQEFADQLAVQIIEVVGPGVSSGVVWNSIDLYNLTNTAEKTNRALNIAGGQIGGGDAPFVAAPLKLLGANELTRDGWKRFAGIPDERVTTGGVLNGQALTWLTSVGDFLSADVDVDDGVVNGGSLTPVIVGTDVVNGGKDLNKINPITGYEVQQYVTTQNTRKRGRGA